MHKVEKTTFKTDKVNVLAYWMQKSQNLFILFLLIKQPKTGIKKTWIPHSHTLPMEYGDKQCQQLQRQWVQTVIRQ